MSKILKVVDGKHYVDGGPACEAVSSGTGYADWRCLNGRRIYTYAKAGRKKDNGECLDCHGTGLQPVEQWSDARKAEWLLENIEHPNGIYFSYHRDAFHRNKNAIAIYDHNWGSGDRLKIIGKAEDFSQALTAAVIAVAEEQE